MKNFMNTGGRIAFMGEHGGYAPQENARISAAAALGAQVQAPRQYWRSQPRGMSQLFGDVRIGMR